MSSRKRKNTVCAWLSANANCEEKQFARVGSSFLQSETVGNISGAALRTYLAMTLCCGGKLYFTFSAADAKRFHISPSSFDRAKSELIDAGLIRLQSSGRLTREKNIYEFGFDWKKQP